MRKVQNGNAIGMCVNRGKKLGTLPGTNGIYFVVDGKVWLVVDGRAVNCGDHFEFREKARAGRVRFEPCS